MPPLVPMAKPASFFGLGSSGTEISDDEASDASGDYAIPIQTKEEKKDVKGKGKAVAKDEPEEKLEVESDDDDEEIGEDEYVVEAITNHLVDEETGELKFEVKWEGFEKKTDRTWEPEENLLETASKMLNEYLDSQGGKELIIQGWKEKKAAAKAAKGGKKRGRASTGEKANGAKRGRTNGHPASSTPPASLSKAEFKPPTGSWEEEVVMIDACEGTEGNVVVYLTWKGGAKSQHPLAQIYKRCPQKMLKFYEDHLVFKKTEDP